jgi:hypothetical protein
MPGSMTWSRTALIEYLYGIRAKIVQDNESKESTVYKKIIEHSWNGKSIKSNFFEQPETENISAILFSNAATIAKFNRMGKLAGLGSVNVKMMRQGSLYNPDPNAFRPIPFLWDVDDPNYEESWSDSIIMYHNPNATYPVNPNWFNDISHIWWEKENEKLVGFIKPYDVVASITLFVKPQ